MEDVTDRLRHRIAALETQVVKVTELQARQGILHESRINLQRENAGVLIERVDHQEQSGYDLAQTLKAVLERVQSLEDEMALTRRKALEVGPVLFEVFDTMQDLVRSEEEIDPRIFDGLLQRLRETAAHLIPH